MWISIDPISGNLYAYPEYAQKLLDNADVDTYVDLGIGCFNAIIFKCSNGKHVQKTNRIRSVKEITDDTQTVLTMQCRDRLWSLHGEVNCISSKLELVPQIPRIILWSWCSQTHFSRFDIDWIPYSADLQDKIENAWTDSVPEIDLLIGLQKYKIVFNFNSSFMFQLSKDNTRRRFVRRCFQTQEQYDHIKSLLCQKADANTRETCAICIENFSDTPHLPLCRLKCGHEFHCACMSWIRISVSPKCPICREEIQ